MKSKLNLLSIIRVVSYLAIVIISLVFVFRFAGKDLQDPYFTTTYNVDLKTAQALVDKEVIETARRDNLDSVVIKVNVPNSVAFKRTPSVGDPALGLGLGGILLVISIIAIIFISILQLIDNPKKSMTSLIGLAVIGIIFVIAYYSSSGAATFGRVSENYAQFVGGSMWLLSILGTFAILSIIVSEVWVFFK